ncbi:hypothetical protein GIB67_041002 [Kingdonia uniflora]|uniref:TTI1 N-terminal TPR domain-containing protein n=1 Tax=Kingdonia uniflora TaxID=39325 RepID=A0A7J7NCL3_9MAGN|nr:hypothetical protein GIB67_041002 [Kingdonia uniflora]
MEDRAANENLNLSVTTDRDELEEETLSRVFSQLKPYCLDILQLVQNPKSKANSVSELYQFLRETPSQYLQPFFDYALFPMLLLLDAAVGCRNPQNVDSGGKFGMPNMSNMTHSISDSVAEVGLLCLEELLRKCHLGSVNQMVVVLKKLTYGALLSPSDAAEEFRERIVKCLRALLLSLQHCSGKSCSCKDIIEVPTFLDSHTSENTHTTCLNYRTEADKCLLAFLQSENASAAVGHWLSLLLKIADTEVARGHRGSSKLRVEAFFTLRLLVSKVGTADALAFFLPGVVSQFAKVFHLSKTMISGAAGSTDSIDQAVRGLSEFLTIVLEDEANISGLSMSVNDITGLYPNNDNSTQSFLERLRHLSGNAPDLHGKISGSSNDQAGGVVTLRSDFKEKNCSTSNVNMGSLQVSRTKDWIGETSIHVDKLLSTTFPHLCVHPAKKVRRGLIEAIRGLLLKCRYTLKKSRLMLLECLCVLVCDDFEEVSVAAQELLDSFFILSEKHLIDSEISEIFNRLIQKLPKVVLGNDKTFALSHAQQLLAVMYYAGPQLVVNHLLQSPVTAAHFLDAIAQCLNQNSVYAGSLEKFILKKPVSVGYLHSIAELKAGPRLEVFKTRSSQENKLQDLVEAVCQDYLVPQMPPWFFYVGSEKLYETLAGILRLVGLSTMADTRSGVSLSVIIDIPLSYLRKLISEVQMKGYSKESWQSWYTRSTSGQLLRQASTAVCVLNEIIYGLSDQSINLYARKFCLSRMNGKDMQEHVWNVCQKDAKEHLANCIGSILHEYLSPELWDLPVGQKASILEMDNEAGNMKLHFFRDTEMLQQETSYTLLHI